MGYVKTRKGRNGEPRYTACYVDVRDVERSAGTFGDKKEAEKAWQDAESNIRHGRLHDPNRGKMRFENYVLDTWLPNHEASPKTIQDYTMIIHRYLIPELGRMRMVEILPEHIRAWVRSMKEQGVNPPTIRNSKIVLSSIFTTAFNDQITWLHPCKGVKTPPSVRKKKVVVTPEKFDMVYRALPDDDARLIAETAIESGMRWGELSELRVDDLDFDTRMLTVSRAVVELQPKFHPEGERFLVKSTKDEDIRTFKLSAQIVAKLKAHRDNLGLGPNDLFFAVRDRDEKPPVVPFDPGSLGFTEPNDKGKVYRHGTTTAYSNGKCRCQYCRAAVAAYRAKRRAEGQDLKARKTTRSKRATDADGHISNDKYRRCVWYPAVTAAGLDPRKVWIHDLRHAHGSWLLAGGADIVVVQKRLGHSSTATTDKYLHTLPELADETALDALSAVRSRSRTSA